MPTKVASGLRLERAHCAQSGWPKLSMHGSPGLLGSATNTPLVERVTVVQRVAWHRCQILQVSDESMPCVCLCVLQHYKLATHGLEATHEVVRPVGRKRHVR